MEENLRKLGYSIKQRMTDGSIDFTNIDINRQYLINLKNDIIIVDFPRKLKKQGLTFYNFNDFLKWHNNYKK